MTTRAGDLRSLRVGALCVALTAAGCGAANHTATAAAPSAPERVHIAVNGNRALDAAEITAALDGERDALVDRTSGAIDPAHASAVRNALLRAYFDHGLVEAEVDAPTAASARSDGTYDVAFVAREGEPYRFGMMRVLETAADGTEVEVLGGRESLRAAMRAQSGSPFDRGLLAHDMLGMQSRYREAGYAFADISPNVEVHRDRHVADVALTIHRGPLAHIGSVRFVGLQRVAEGAARARVQLHAGDVFHESALTRTHDELMRMNAFSSVELDAQPGADHPDIADVTITVREQP